MTYFRSLGRQSQFDDPISFCQDDGGNQWTRSSLEWRQWKSSYREHISVVMTKAQDPEGRQTWPDLLPRSANKFLMGFLWWRGRLSEIEFSSSARQHERRKKISSNFKQPQTDFVFGSVRNFAFRVAQEEVVGATSSEFHRARKTRFTQTSQYGSEMLKTSANFPNPKAAVN